VRNGLHWLRRGIFFKDQGCEGRFEESRRPYSLVEAFREVLVDVRIQQASITEFAKNEIIASFYPFLE